MWYYNALLVMVVTIMAGLRWFTTPKPNSVTLSFAFLLSLIAVACIDAARTLKQKQKESQTKNKPPLLFP